MTGLQIALVQASFERVEPIAEEAAELFYARLFELDPALRPLFRGDIREQGRKLMHMIGLAAKGLSRLEELVPKLRSLGERHSGYGVEDRHYDTVGEALLWTLEKGLGPAFDAETKNAWSAAFSLLARTMKESSGHLSRAAS